MKVTLLTVVFDRLLTDPLNEKICKIGLAICATGWFGAMVVSYIINQ